MANEQKNKSIGEVKIAADVVAAIAGLAATEVDGVYAMAGTHSNDWLVCQICIALKSLAQS